jgi:uncharacterized protein (DUF2237 family)
MFYPSIHQGGRIAARSARLEYGFAGLKPGDRWCLCADRWQEALEAGVAPPVVLVATHEAALERVRREELLRHAVDIAGGAV